MATQELRDRTGRLIGKIKELHGGKLELRSRTGRMLGRFDPRSNQTRDRTGKLVGKGNLLTTLLDR